MDRHPVAPLTNSNLICYNIASTKKKEYGAFVMKKLNVSKKEILALVLCAIWMIISFSCFSWILINHPGLILIDPMHPAESGFPAYFFFMLIFGGVSLKIMDICGVSGFSNNNIKKEPTPS